MVLTFYWDSLYNHVHHISDPHGFMAQESFQAFSWGVYIHWDSLCVFSPPQDEKALRNNKKYKTIDTNKNGVRFHNSSLQSLNDQHMAAKENYNETQKAVVSEIVNISSKALSRNWLLVEFLYTYRRLSKVQSRELTFPHFGWFNVCEQQHCSNRPSPLWVLISTHSHLPS